jgi:catechol 2,3-dioxygenase-like lactoylglutathione lyase family enzyme
MQKTEATVGGCGRVARRALCCVALWPVALLAQDTTRTRLPRLHHVGLNSVEPERAIDWYLRLWPTATRTVVNGEAGVKAEMLLLFQRVDSPPAGQWSDREHRSVPQSAFWHIGAFTNTSATGPRLQGARVRPLPLFVSATDTVGVTRSGLAPYAGTLTAAQLPNAPATAAREGGFSYVVAPDGVLFELTGGPGTRDALAHVHFFHEQPLCAANWYVEHLGMRLPPMRDSAGTESPRARWDPCIVPYGEAGWPSLERVGTIRQPAGAVQGADATISWYPRQCSAARCGRDEPLVTSRGQALDHVAFVVHDFDLVVARLRRAGVRFLEEPHPFDATRACMIEGPDRLAIELIAER